MTQRWLKIITQKKKPLDHLRWIVNQRMKSIEKRSAHANVSQKMLLINNSHRVINSDDSGLTTKSFKHVDIFINNDQ